MTVTMIERIRGCLIGLAVGDALGVPVETMTHEEIKSATNGLGINGFHKPLQTKIRDTGNMPPGSYSDDTQLTLVTLRSLVRSVKFDLRDQAMALVEAYESSTFGWGGTTRDAAQALKDWRDSGGTKGRAPEVIAPEPPDPKKRGCGSGVAMRIAPLAIHHLFPTGFSEQKAWDRFRADTMSLGLLTHADPRASIAAIALGAAIHELSDDLNFLKHAPMVAMNAVDAAEKLYGAFRPASPRFSQNLRTAFSLMQDPVELRKQVNTGFSAIESVPFAIATALRHPGDFRTAVLEGVNAGQDADTVGSMIGAIVGARVGIKGIPSDWIMHLHGAGGIFYLADQLAQAIFTDEQLAK